MSWTNTARLSLESLDARIVPDATPVLPNPGPEPPANVSTTAPPAPRPVAEILADIQSVSQLVKQATTALTTGRADEAKLAVDVRLARLNAEAALQASDVVFNNPLSTPLMKANALLNATNAQIAFLEVRSQYVAKVNANASLAQNLEGLKNMLAALKNELEAARGAPNNPVPNEVSDQTLADLEVTLRDAGSALAAHALDVAGSSSLLAALDQDAGRFSDALARSRLALENAEVLA